MATASRWGRRPNSILRNLTVRELVFVLGSSELVLCNDSGPSHIAAECKRPVIAFFGPGNPPGFGRGRTQQNHRS